MVLITQLTSASGLAGHLDRLTGHDAVTLLVLLAHASDHMSAAVPLYARLLQADPPGRAAAAADAALTARTAQPLLDAALAAEVTSTRWTPDSLAELSRHLPEGRLPRTRAAVSAAAVDHARETGTRDDLANALTSYGVSLTDLGRHREARTAFEEALALYRNLAAANPAHQPRLARALTNYGIILRDEGRDSEARAYDREALEVYATLAHSDPDLYEQTYQHHLAELRRTYDLRGDQSASVSLHLPHDNKSQDQS
jgi:tetratricopeptide (TPR) repeat protein